MTKAIPHAFFLAILAVATANAQTAAPTPSPAAAPAEAGKPPAASEQKETPAVVVDGSAADTLLGKPVRTTKGEDLGRVVDVIVDRSGVVRAAVIDFGGFLGVGTRKVAVDWRVLHFPQKGAMDALIADLSKDQVRAAPAFKPGEAVVIMGGGTAEPAASASPSPVAPIAPAGPPAPKL
jgi:PRC-barrel domain